MLRSAQLDRLICVGSAQAGATRCPAGEVRSVSATPVLMLSADALRDGAPQALSQERLPGAPGTAFRDDKITAVGPVLASMDSHVLETVVSCNPRGFTVRATITRSAYYNGAALKNVPWRPKIEIAVAPSQSPYLLEVTWAMRLSNGVVVHHSLPPPDPALDYPITVSSMLR